MSKKDFSTNPAMQFVSGNVPKEETKVPEGCKKNPEFVEVKTKRVQLVMQPTLYHRAKVAAEANGLSFNSYIHKVLEKALSETEDS